MIIFDCYTTKTTSNYKDNNIVSNWFGLSVVRDYTQGYDLGFILNL